MNNTKIKTPMPEQKSGIRNKNFSEVALGYTEEMALNEAQRCLNCKNKPCVSGCPVNVRIPEFIAAVVEKNYKKAGEIIESTNSLPAVCGRVCPQEVQCEGKCVRGIKGEPVGIGRLERFVADWNIANNHEAITPLKSNGKRAAVIGAGPAGLTVAGDLAKKGCQVTIFEAFHKAGGVLVYGIPQFRLPKEIVQKEIDNLKALGVRIELNSVIGKTLTVKELFKMGYQSIFIGSGAGLPLFMNIPGENLLGVYSANEYLTRINLMKAYSSEYDTPILKSKKVTVVGGGNVAIDAARCAKRMGAETVYIVYRRGEEELPARAEEIHHAKEEGIIFKLLNNPVEIHGDTQGHVVGMKCIQMILGEPDATGRRRPIEKAGSEFILDVDTVIMAIGTSPNPLIRITTEDLEFNKRGYIAVDAFMATSLPGVYAGGDAVTGAATVILAMGAGKIAAEAMDRYMQGMKIN